MNYKDTLNLPKTAFAMKANLPQREPAMLAHWAELKLYQRQAERNQAEKRPSFILHDGPPYANGDIHIGHAVNKVLKDIILRAKNLSGYATPFVPGWDCHGLPIELNVEKKIGKVGDKLSRTEFRQACRDYAKGQIDKQKAAFQRLGILADWDNPYVTMDFSFEAEVVRALGQLIEKGHLHAGHKPVHWCVACGSALAEAEVEYCEKQSTAIDVAFTLTNTSSALSKFITAQSLNTTLTWILPIWTTTPWTLPANQAVCVHPELTYSVIKTNLPKVADTPVYLVLAEALYESTLARWQINDYQLMTSLKGQELAGCQLQHPFLPRQVPVILGDHVTTEAGTGLVHTAPAHGQEDYIVAKNHQLPLTHSVDDHGRFQQETPFFAGLSVLKADEAICALLIERHALLNTAALHHSYPHCWRHKRPLIFRATPQWFIRMDDAGLRQAANKAITEQVKWLPDWGQARIASMITHRPDWCLSRQRAWGTPMPLFIHKKTGTLHPKTNQLIESVAQRIEQEGMDAWDALDPKELLGQEAEQYKKVTDTLDVWFDSGVTHAAVLKKRPELQYPADLYLEGSDQHRGWFQSSLLTSVAINNTPCYHTVLTHGFTVDAKGHKMSKSLGNVIYPKKVIDRLGADVLRLWVASTDYRGEMHVSDEILQRNSDSYRRLRNTARFLLGNLHDFNPTTDSIPGHALLALDHWAIAQAQALDSTIRHAFDHYAFHQITHNLQTFCTVTMGGFYLDVIKDRLYTEHANSSARRSAQTAMYYILEALVRWLAPILCFTAEEIWQHMPGKRVDSVYLSEWFEQWPSLPPKNTLDWTQLLIVRDAVNKALESERQAGNIGSPLDAQVTVYCDTPYHEQLVHLGEELHFLFISSLATLHPLTAAPSTASSTELAHLKVLITPLADEKCARCWHRSSAIGQDARHPALCPRCIANVTGEDIMERQYV